MLRCQIRKEVMFDMLKTIKKKNLLTILEDTRKNVPLYIVIVLFLYPSNINVQSELHFMNEMNKT